MAISDIVRTTVEGFIDYALIIVVIMLIYYFFKFFMVAPPTKEEREARQRESEKSLEEWKGKFSERMKKKKTEEEEKTKKAKKKVLKRRKEDLVLPVKRNIVLATEAADDAVSKILSAKTKADCDDIVNQFKAFNKQMEEAWGNLKTLRRKADDKGEKDALTKLMTHAESIKEYVVNNLKGTLPKMSPDFAKKAQSAEVIKNIKKVRGMCHQFWNEVEKFHK